MPETQELTFPDLPVGQWSKLRTLFKSNLPKTIDIDFLASILKISESTARNTFRNLVLLRLVEKEGKVTDRANDWRTDDLYPQVCKEIAEEVYPPELRDLAQTSGEREALVNWFTRKTKIGTTAAHKNAAIFEVINYGDLPKSSESNDGKGQDKVKARGKPKSKTTKQQSHSQKGDGTTFQPIKPFLPNISPNPSIHIDIQIHISPDAKPEQIEQIFASIEKHLYQPRQLADEQPG